MYKNIWMTFGKIYNQKGGKVMKIKITKSFEVPDGKYCDKFYLKTFKLSVCKFFQRNPWPVRCNLFDTDLKEARPTKNYKIEYYRKCKACLKAREVK